MAGNEKLKSVCRNIVSEFYAAEAAFKECANKKFSPYETFNRTINKESSFLKLSQAFKKIASLIPEDKKSEAHAKVEEYFKATFTTAQSFTNMKKRITASPDLPTQRQKDLYIFEKPMNNFFLDANSQELFDVMTGYLDDMELDDVAEEIDNFQSPAAFNIKMYPRTERVEELKKQNAEKITDPAQLKELNDELDAIAKAIVFSPLQYGNKFDSLDNTIAHELNVKTEEMNTRQLESEQYKGLKEYFKECDQGSHYGVYLISDEHVDDVNMSKEFLKEDRKFVIPEDKKKGLLNILNFMKESGMLDTRVIGESNGKTYAFIQIGEAQQKLDDLLAEGSTDTKALKEAREEYEHTLQNMREVYKMIEEQIQPNEEMAIGNLNSYRALWVPNEFKNNFFANSYANAIYNLGSMLIEYGIDFEDMVNDPSEALFRCFEPSAKNLTPNDMLKDRSLASAFAAVHHGDSFVGYPLLAVGRHAEFIRQLSVGTDLYEQNTVAMMLTMSYDNRIQSLTTNANISAAAGFFRLGDPLQTAANMFIVDEKDRDYNKLRSFEALSVDGMQKIPPFNASEYLETHDISPESLLNRLKDTVQDIYDYAGSAYEIGRTAMAIRAAQIAAHEFMMAHPVVDPKSPDNFFTKNQYNEFKKIVESPEKVFKKLMTKEVRAQLKDYGEMRQYVNNIETRGNYALQNAREEARDAEEAYNTKASDLEKKIKDLEKGSKEQNQLEEAKAELTALRQAEIKRLEEAYTQGKLPKDYFEQRRADVDLGKQANKVPFGASERPSFETFMEENADALDGMSQKEIKYAYNSMMENALRAENQFKLVAAKEQPCPTLDPQPDAQLQASLQTKEKEPIVVMDACEPTSDIGKHPIKDEMVKGKEMEKV